MPLLAPVEALPATARIVADDDARTAVGLEGDGAAGSDIDVCVVGHGDGGGGRRSCQGGERQGQC